MPTCVYPVIIREGEDGQYVASCPAIEGCHSQGATLPEAFDNIREAIALCLEVIRDEGVEPPSSR